MTETYERDPDDAADDELAERTGHPATAEEAMDDATGEDGHPAESGYTPNPGLIDEPGTEEDEQ
jgi:hypothetical protein